MTTTTKTATVTEADIEKYLAAKQEVSFKYNKAGAKIWYHAHAIIGTGAIDNGKFAGWSVDHDVKINRYEAALYLEKYGLTVEQFVAAEKEFYATRYPKDETTAEYNVEVIAENVTAEADDTEANNTVDTEAELIKHNGLSFEGFLATNAGLTIEEYRARKAEQQAAEQAEAERRTKIFNLKDGIASVEYTINETSGTLNDIIKNHYRPESDDGSWDEYTAELGDTLATAVNTLDTLKAQLAELEPATDTTTTEAEENTAQVEETTEDVIATIDPEIIYKAVKTVGGEVQRTISRGFEKGGKEMWFSFGRRISKTRAAELLAECGFRSIDEFIAAEKVAEQYKDEVLWPRWDTNRQQAKFLRNKIWAEVKPCDDDDESFTANVMPAEDDDTDDELIDPPDRRTIERNSGNYGTWINGEYVRFENHSIFYIDAERKNGYSYSKVNGRKNFYRYGRKIAASKIAEAYMNGQKAAEQSKAHHEFFNAHKLEVGKTFQLSFEITTADGQEHFFSRTFETFAEAKALVDEFTATFSEPTQIVIKQNKQNGDWFYSRDTDGTEKFFDAFCKLNATEEDKPTTEEITATKPAIKITAADISEETLMIMASSLAAIADEYYKKDSELWTIAMTGSREAQAELNRREAKTTATETEPMTKEQIEKLMHAIAVERGEFYGALEEAEADDEISQSHIDYLKDEIDRLGEEYNELWAQLVKLQEAEKAETATEPREDDWEISNKLTRKLNRNVRLSNYTEVITQDGERIFVNFKAPHVEPDGNTDHGFAFVHYNTTLGRYDTCEQAETVINLITATIERGEEKFTFPTVDELNQPTTTEEVLNKLLLKAIANVSEMQITLQDGNKIRRACFSGAYITMDYYSERLYIQTNWGDTYARYDTPEQVETVINMLKAAIERGDKEFTFPAVDVLNQPPTVEEVTADKTSKPTEVKRGAKFVEGKFYNDMDWATFGAGKKCFKILKRTACYVTIGDYSPYWKDYLENGRYKIQTDSDGNEYIHYWSGERLCAKFLTVDEHLRGSLKRAAEIARRKYHEYEREGDKAGMLREIELFSICTDAIKELEAA